jgi:hypothetical protein
MVDRSSLRLSATLVVIGEVLFALVTAFHPGREDANNHPAVFAEYASSASWTAVHFGQFIRYRLMLAGPTTTIAIAEWESEELGKPGAQRYREWLRSSGIAEKLSLETYDGPTVVAS